MTVPFVEFIVEEPSMEVFLRTLLPRTLESLAFEVYPFRCKSELLQHLPSRLRGYGTWLPDDYLIMVLVDRDDDDCHRLKQQLDGFASRAGLAVTRAPDQHGVTLTNRIVIEELEAWYFGDWEAVRAAYPRVSPKVPQRARYRNPDAIPGGTWEAFERELQRAGYFAGGLRKLEVARAVAAHMVPQHNQSHSFRVFWSKLLTDWEGTT